MFDSTGPKTKSFKSLGVGYMARFTLHNFERYCGGEEGGVSLSFPTLENERFEQAEFQHLE